MPLLYATPEDYQEFLTRSEAIDASILDDPQSLIGDIATLQTDLRTASTKITGRLNGRYNLVSADYPDLRRICIRIARWEREGATGLIRDAVQIQYEEAIADLEKIAKGQYALVNDDGEIVSPVLLPDGDESSNGQSFVGDRGKNVCVPNFGQSAFPSYWIR